MAQLDWDKYGYVTASNYRKNVVVSLSEKPKTPKEIADDTGYYLSHISNTLKDLREHNIALCLTEGRERGRVYSLTELGVEIAKQLMK